MTYRLTKTWPDPHMQKLAAWTLMMMNSAGPAAADLHVSREAIVAQAALESAWGAVAIGNNLYGIKADASWTGLRQARMTREVINGQSVMISAEFRDYATVADSIRDHTDFLHRNGYYQNILAEGQAGTLTDQRYFELLHEDGYATDPNYAQALMGMLASVKIFTSCMVDDAVPSAASVAAPPPGYVEQPSGNIIREDVHQSEIVKGTDKAMTVVKVGTAAAGAVGMAAPAVTAVGAMDWKLAAVLGGTVILGIVVGVAAYCAKKLIDAKTNRISMNVAGIA